MECSIFPSLFEKKKQEELQKYTDAREREFADAKNALSLKYATRFKRAGSGWTRGDVCYFDYWKSMYYLFLIIFAFIGAVIGPIASLDYIAPEQLIGKILAILLGILAGILVGALGCIISGTIPFTILIIVISPIVYFVIYPLSRKAKDKRYERRMDKLEKWHQGELSRLQEEKTSALKAHREETDREIREYREHFDSQAREKGREIADNFLARNASTWLIGCLLKHLASLDRDENTKILETEFSFSVASSNIACGADEHPLARALDADLNKMALAYAIVQNITRDLPEDSAYQDLGDTFLSFNPQVVDLSSTAKVTLRYQATNGAFLQSTQQKN